MDKIIIKAYFFKTASKTTQPDAWCKIPTGGVHSQGTFASFFTNVIDVQAEIGTASFIFEMKVFSFNDFTQDSVVPQYVSLLL